MTKISSSDVRKVAKLARLELPEEQIETYTKELEEILSYVDQLQEIDTQNIVPTTRAVEVVNSMREDLVQVHCEREEILNPHFSLSSMHWANRDFSEYRDVA